MGKQIAIGIVGVVGVLVLLLAVVVGRWFYQSVTTERAVEEFCATLEPGMTRAEVEAAIDADPEVFDSSASISSGGANGPQPSVSRGEFLCWCGTNFEQDRLVSVNAAFCID